MLFRFLWARRFHPGIIPRADSLAPIAPAVSYGSVARIAAAAARRRSLNAAAVSLSLKATDGDRDSSAHGFRLRPSGQATVTDSTVMHKHKTSALMGPDDDVLESSPEALEDFEQAETVAKGAAVLSALHREFLSAASVLQLVDPETSPVDEMIRRLGCVSSLSPRPRPPRPYVHLSLRTLTSTKSVFVGTNSAVDSLFREWLVLSAFDSPTVRALLVKVLIYFGMIALADSLFFKRRFKLSCF